MTSDLFRHIADLLERASAPEAELADISSELWKTKRHNPALEAIASNFEHFVADADIGNRDPSYREFQEAELRRLVGLLREEENVESAVAVNFLYRSGIAS